MALRCQSFCRRVTGVLPRFKGFWLSRNSRLSDGNLNLMPQNITLSSADLVETARAQITELSPQQAIPLVGDPGVVLVDIRDVRELDRDGRVPGAFHCPRGMLEFWIDPASPYHKPVFADDKQFVFFCGGGMRSVLATKVAQDMGLKPVAHIIGGFAAWKAADGPIEKSERKPV
jgi:rhodanese-related sulfurtransferase